MTVRLARVIEFVTRTEIDVRILSVVSTHNKRSKMKGSDWLEIHILIHFKLFEN